MHLSKRTKLLLGILLFLVIAIPITISLVTNPQDQRTRASGATSLSLIPQPGPDSSIEKTVGETVNVDVVVEPGSNAVGNLRMQVKYDPTKLEYVSYTPIFPQTANAQSLPYIVDGPTSSNGIVSVSVTAGFDPTKALTVQKAAGTFAFKALAQTPEDKPTVVSFTNATQAYSFSSNDTSLENVLSTTNPANITILAAASNPTVTQTPAGETSLSFRILLHGIGIAGDTPNPNSNSFSNKNPKTPQRNLIVELYDSNDQLVKSANGTLTYHNNDSDDNYGAFTGQVAVPSLSSGNYTVKVKSDRYLRKAFPGVITLTSGQQNVFPQIALVAGDTDNNNSLNLLDYNALLDCGYGELNALPITNSGAAYNSAICKTHEPRPNIDIDDNGFVNAFDYNLFLRELSVQGGD